MCWCVNVWILSSNYSPFCLLLTAYRLLLTAYCLPLTAYCLPPTAYRPLPPAYFSGVEQRPVPSIKSILRHSGKCGKHKQSAQQGLAHNTHDLLWTGNLRQFHMRLPWSRSPNSFFQCLLWQFYPLDPGRPGEYSNGYTLRRCPGCRLRLVLAVRDILESTSSLSGYEILCAIVGLFNNDPRVQQVFMNDPHNSFNKFPALSNCREIR